MGLLHAALLAAGLHAAASEQELDRLRSALANGQTDVVETFFAETDERLTGELYRLRGSLRLAQGRPKDAVDDLEKAAKAMPKQEEVWLQLADAAGEAAGQVGGMGAAGFAKTAKRALEKVVQLNPDRIEARAGLIQFHLQAPWIMGGRKKEAYRQAEAIGKLDPVQGKVWKARVDLATGEADDAETLFRGILAAHPDQADIAVTLGTILHGKSKWSEANDVLRPFAEADPPHLSALYQVGRTGALSGEFLESSAAAMERYLKLAENDEDRPVPLAPAYWRLGMIFQHQDELDRARDAFEQALSLDPENKEAEAALNAL